MHNRAQRELLISKFIERNSKINLSAIRDSDEIFNKHILDALEIEKIEELQLILKQKDLKACDVGTGWWFPLLPLATIHPNISRTGLDARNKKINAINDMAQYLWLDNCTAIHDRIEEHTTRYDVVTARAVAYADTLLPRVDHILKPWGIAIFYKLYTIEEDKIIEKYWRKIEKKHKYTLRDNTKRVIYVLRKKPKVKHSNYKVNTNHSKNLE